MTLPDWRVPMFVACEHQLQALTGLPRFRMRWQLLGVGDGQRAGRDRLRAVGEGHDAGVRVAVMVGADRADDDRQRALLAGDGRALRAAGAELAVARSVLVRGIACDRRRRSCRGPRSSGAAFERHRAVESRRSRR